MEKKQWDEWERLYEDFTRARQAYERAQSHLRGSFSELARHYEDGTLDMSRRYEEELAHEKFIEKRDKLRAFMDANLKIKNA